MIQAFLVFAMAAAFAGQAEETVTARVCNGRAETISVAIARRSPSDTKVSSGWWTVAPGGCESFSFADTRTLYAMALTPDGQRLYPLRRGGLNALASFCIDRSGQFTEMNVDYCHDRPEENPYKYDAPGKLKFVRFGRVSGVESYTFE